jgi:peptidoglycan/xylan/chitin deacetylase (PgdA/CDA1 family)
MVGGHQNRRGSELTRRGNFFARELMRATRTPWQRFAESAIERTGLLSVLERLDRRSPSAALPILMFHRIQDPEACGDQSEADLISAPPTVFAREMEFVARHFQPISGVELLAALDGRPLPPRSVLVSFDDGTRDFLEHAWPVLERLRIPSILCVPTAFPGRSDAIFWEDRLHQVVSRTPHGEVDLDGLGRLDLSTPAARARACYQVRTYLHQFPGAVPDRVVDALERQLGVRAEPFGQSLTWSELREVGELVALVPHGQRHVRLAGMAAAEIDAEVAGSLAVMRERLGACLPIIAYPYGSFDTTVLSATHRAGYRAGLSTRAGFASLANDRLNLRRVNIYHGTLTHFRLDLTRTFAWYLARRADLEQRRMRRAPVTAPPPPGSAGAPS